MTARIRVGIGGWIFPPWRGTFYPAHLPHARELEHASAALTAIEINATFHRTQTPQSFARWRSQTPDGFAFSLKAPRAATQRRELAEAGPSIERFLDSGIAELGDRLGPIVWQFPATRRFDADAVSRFLDFLPSGHAGLPLAHAVEAAHASFDTQDAVLLLRERGIARVLVDTPKGEPAGDLTASFVYARLKANAATAPEGYDTAALDRWAARARTWAAGGDCDDLIRVAPPAAAQDRAVWLFCIAGDKVRAPDSARALLRRLDG